MAYGSFNQGAYGSGNQQALGSGNQAAYLSGNQAAYLSGNQQAVVSGNQAAYASGNQAAYLSGNQAAYLSGNQAAQPGLPAAAWGAAGPVAAVWLGPGTGAGNPSGHGFLGGYGPVPRSDYATPAALGPLPWVLDFARGNGWAPFPTAQRINPYAFTPHLQWEVGDWDPGLRFWTLPFDVHLTEWLQDLDLSRPAVMVAREFAAHHGWWLARDAATAGQSGADGVHRLQDLLDAKQHLGWLAGEQTKADAAWTFIERELVQLDDLMQDDRGRYLPEADWQSANIATYFFHLMGLNPQAKPATVELLNCATAIANLVKMQYKAHYRRPRPSALCPGLVPPWGPPGHPAFPSGHSLVAHLVALFLLSIPGLAQRFGIFKDEGNKTARAVGRVPRLGDFLGKGSVRWSQDAASPLLWLAWRVARTRERLGLHYPSDSQASRRLAAGLWAAVLQPAPESRTVAPMDAKKEGPWRVPYLALPSLQVVFDRACAEWPERPVK